MSIWPYRKFKAATKLSKTEVLNAIVESERFTPCVGSGISKEMLENELVQNNQFKIRPHIHYRNAFMPIFIGKFADKELGDTEINVVMRPRIIVYLLSLLVVLLTMVPAYQAVSGLIQTGSITEDGIYATLILLVFVGSLFIAFGAEVPKRKKYFLEMLQAEELD